MANAMETAATVDIEARPFPWWAVAGWAGAMALGLAVTALGHFPTLSLYHIEGLAAADYRLDWGFYGRALAWAALGGLCIGLIQWRILAAIGDPLARRGPLWWAAGWTLGWGILIFTGSFVTDNRVGRIDYEWGKSLPFLAATAWLWAAYMGIYFQLRLVKGAPARSVAFVGLMSVAGWSLGGLLYWWLLDRFDGGFAGTIWLAIPAGALLGGLIGLGWRYNTAFVTWAEKVTAWPRRDRLPALSPSNNRRAFSAGEGVALAVGVLVALLLWATVGQLCVDSTCRASIPPGPAVPWTEQLRMAQESARMLEPEAILIAVTAQVRETAGTAPDQQPVIVAFHYYSPAGRAAEGQYSGWGDMRVGFADTDPQGTLRIKLDDQRTEDYGATGHSNAQTALPLVQIGPREALMQIRAARQAALGGPGPAGDVQVEARLVLPVPMGSLSSDQALRRFWRVQYDNPAMDFGVDAATGEVMRLDKPAGLR